MVPAGIITRLEQPDKGGHRRVEFRCKHCQHLHVARWCQLRMGFLKSCGCQSRMQFIKRYEEEAQRLSRRSREHLFDQAECEGFPRAPGHSRYLCCFAHRGYVEKLRAMPVRTRRHIESEVQRVPFAKIAAAYAITCLAIVRIIRELRSPWNGAFGRFGWSTSEMRVLLARGRLRVILYPEFFIREPPPRAPRLADLWEYAAPTPFEIDEIPDWW